VFEESVGTVKNMVYKKRGMLSMSPEEIKDKIEIIAKIVDVSGWGSRKPLGEGAASTYTSTTARVITISGQG
jgi:hypothetical protein